MSDEPTAAQVAQDVADKVTTGIEVAAEALKKIAPHAWDILVRQQRAEGFVMLTIGLVGMVVCGVLHRKNLATTYESDRHDPMSSGAKKVIVGSLIVLANIYPVVLTATGALKVYNPEYYAAVEIVGRVK